MAEQERDHHGERDQAIVPKQGLPPSEPVRQVPPSESARHAHPAEDRPDDSGGLLCQSDLSDEKGNKIGDVNIIGNSENEIDEKDGRKSQATTFDPVWSLSGPLVDLA